MQKARSHKYIRRLGGPRHYKYVYDEEHGKTYRMEGDPIDKLNDEIEVLSRHLKKHPDDKEAKEDWLITVGQRDKLEKDREYRKEQEEQEEKRKEEGAKKPGKWKPFGLTEVPPRHIVKVTGEIGPHALKMEYYTYFAPKGLSKEEADERRSRFKSPENAEDLAESEKMIRYTVDKFFKENPIEKFDAILGVKSSKDAVKRILNYVQSVATEKGWKGIIFGDAILPRLLGELKESEVFWHEAEGRPKAMDEFLSRFKIEGHEKEEVQVHSFGHWRRYIENFKKLNPNINLKQLEGKSVLVVDDTIGEGVSLGGARKALKDRKVDSFTGFTVMRDY